MATPRKRIDDGLLVGYLVIHSEPCGNCGVPTWPFQIESILLPQGIKPSTKLIVYREGAHGLEQIKHIGFACGCYGKFHRQIAHIQSRMKK
jgi:hypothetical protein